MHLKRWISGLVLAPLLILFTLSAPPLLFSLLILALVFIGLREFSALALPDLPSLDRAAGILAGLLAPLACSFPGSGLFSAVLAGLILFLFIRALSSPDPFGARVDRTGRQLLGFLYVPFLLSHFVLLRSLPAGELWVLFVLTAVFSGDTAAFYVGRARGRTKLAPAISPGKTVEGAWGAAAGAAAGALLFKFLFFPQIPFFPALILGLGAGVVGQLGDLWESLLKRSAGAKDSGILIPGHGGLLDRIDGVLFAGPLVYYCVRFWGLGN